MPTLAHAPSNASRMQVGFMGPRLETSEPDLMRCSISNQFVRPGTEAPIGYADCSPEGWPNVADFNTGYHASSGMGLPIDPLMTGLIAFSWKGRCVGGFNIAGNCTNLQFSYDPATDRTTGSYVTTTTGPGAGYTRLEFRGSTFKDTDGTQKPGLRDIRFLRPRHPGSLTETYTGSEEFTDEFIGYCRKYDYIRYFTVGTGLSRWEERTPPYWWNQNAGISSDPSGFPAYLKTLRPGAGPLGPSLESMIAVANAANRSLLICFPPNATRDFMVKWVKATLYGTDAAGMPYDGPVSNPVNSPLDPSLWMMLEGGLEPWNFALPYIVDMFSYVDQAIYHSEQNDDVWQALKLGLDVTGWPTQPQPQQHPAFQDILARMRIYQLIQLADVVREIDPSALNTRIRLIYSPAQVSANVGMDWHQLYIGKLHPNTPYAGPARDIRDDIWGCGAQSYWSFADPQGLTDAVADPSFAAPAVPAGYSPRPSGGSWSFSGDAGIAQANGQDIPPAYAGQQMGYVGSGGEATTSFVVPADGSLKTYDLKFKALRRASDPAQAKFKVYLDRGTPSERDVTPQSYVDRDGTVSPRAYGERITHPVEVWPARLVGYVDSDWYATPTLELVPGASHTITVVGAGSAGTCVFVGAVRVGSADRIANSARPVGGPGSTVDKWLELQRFDAARIRGYGPEWTNYESAPSLGSDDHGTPLQQFIRYSAPSTVDAQLDMYRMMAALGLARLTQGVYDPVSNWSDSAGQQGYINPGNFSIVKAVEQVRSGGLAVEYYGTPLPGTLNYQNRQYEYARPNNSYLINPNETIGWTAVVANAGVYRLTLTQDANFPDYGPTSIDLMVDGRTVANGASPVVADVALPAGPHWIRLRHRSGAAGAASIVAERTGPMPDPSPATTYVLAVGTSRAVGVPIPITATLAGGDPLETDLVITLACPGATIAGPITIPAGSTSGSGSITPTQAGTFTLASSHAGATGIADPGTITLTFTASDPDPDPQPGTRRVILFRR